MSENSPTFSETFEDYDKLVYIFENELKKDINKFIWDEREFYYVYLQQKIELGLYTHYKKVITSAHALVQMFLEDRKTEPMVSGEVFRDALLYIQEDLKAVVESKGVLRGLETRKNYLFYSQKYEQGFICHYGIDPILKTPKPMQLFVITILAKNKAYISDIRGRDGKPLETIYRGVPENKTPFKIYPKRLNFTYSESFKSYIESYLTHSKIIKEEKTYLFSYQTTEDFTIILREGKFFGLKDIEIIEI